MTYTVRMKRSTDYGSSANSVLIRGTTTPLDAYKLWDMAYLFEYSDTGYFSVWKTTSGSWRQP